MADRWASRRTTSTSSSSGPGSPPSRLGLSRAMKNMGFERLVLVRPECEIGAEARAYRDKRREILDRALFLPDSKAASRHVGILVGRYRPLRSRARARRLPTLAQEMTGQFSAFIGRIAFGCEENGLSRRTCALCTGFCKIPTGSDYPVMNLARRSQS